MTAILSNQISRTMILTVTGSVVAANLLIKAVIEQWLSVGESWWLVEDKIGLERVNNSGIAFGIDPGSGVFVSTIVLLALLSLVWMVLSGMMGQSRLAVAAAGLILGGAIGNAIDRIPDGVVTDYVALWGWPRFNVADASLTVGICAIILIELQAARRTKS